MHPALSLDTLSQLSNPTKTLATNAANGSFDDFVKLFPLFRSNPHLAYLPVCYVNLNPTPNEDSIVAFNRAYLSLRGLHALSESLVIPLGAGVDLWPRVWKWAWFMHAMCPTDHTICLALSELVSHFTEDPRCLVLINNTVGVRILLVRAWRFMFDGHGDTRIVIGMPSIARVLKHLRLLRKAPDEASDREELSEGAGGNFVDFVGLIAQYIDLVVPTARSEVTAQTHFYMDAILHTINRLRDSDLQTGLLIPSMIRMLSAFTRYAGPYISSFTRGLSATDDLLGAILAPIFQCCNFSPQVRNLEHLVSAGILRSIVGFALRGTEVELASEVLRILTYSTVYFSVVSQMEAGFEDAQDLLADPALPSSELFGAWTKLRVLAEERIAIAKSWQSSGHGTRKACDNVECARIGRKADFQCCGHCHTVYYCSRACQRADWNEGDHRVSCPHLRVFGQENADLAGTRDLSFMRALLHRDYQMNKAEVIRQRIEFLREHSEEEPYVLTVFDYGLGPVCVQTQDVKLSGFAGVNFSEHVARNIRSRGQMDMHLLSLPDVLYGLGELRGKMLPMRSDSSALHDGVRRLAAEAPRPKDLSLRIQQLLEATSAVVEIH
ncbi:hypothetical protein DFH06DRAFT_326459 [Mycena polygramma]|nr:hypothetical protein DFH06DRAFT_326459 [Mycena polygramma]